MHTFVRMRRFFLIWIRLVFCAIFIHIIVVKKYSNSVNDRLRSLDIFSWTNLNKQSIEYKKINAFVQNIRICHNPIAYNIHKFECLELQ